ncbi:MAG: hypothetical protein EAS51_11390 [Microbacteriaceae bacterium]|nr:MAG: hypothetical protein EAS51_11390 [Microbacteriaceae bacterium]
MTDITYLDSGVCLGRLANGAHLDVAELLAEMDAHGIQASAAHHAVAREHDPATGNAQLITEIADSPRILPVWTVLPSHTDEFPHPDDFVAQARAAGVGLARMFPAVDLPGHRLALREWSVGPLLSALERARIPLFLDFLLFRRGEPPWDDIVEVCEHHPDLIVILVDVQGRNNRNLYPLLSRYPGLRVQSSGFNVHNGIEDLCERFGAERLVFGSGAPHGYVGSARFHLDRARISDQERALIASGNLLAMLEAQKGVTP